jgi:hypothetical protein
MPEVFVTISSGEVVEKKTLERFIKTLPNGRGLLKFEDKNKHSDNQRGYYFSTIVPHVLILLRDLGYNEFKTKEQVHEFLKYKFNPVYILDIDTAEQVRTPGSTKKMLKVRYMQYIDDILQWAAEHSYFIPEPLNSEDKYKR